MHNICEIRMTHFLVVVSTIGYESLEYLYFVGITLYVFLKDSESILAPGRWLEHFLFDRKIRSTTIKKDPIFIIGHWRSGKIIT